MSDCLNLLTKDEQYLCHLCALWDGYILHTENEKLQ